MRDISTKADGTTTLPAAAFNSTQVEVENIVTDTGQSLDPDGGADTDLYMMSKAAAIYSSDAGFYTDSGAADAYVLSKVGSLQHPTAYYDGMLAEFKATNSCTGTSTVNVAGIGVTPIRTDGNNNVARGDITKDKYIRLRYKNSAGVFELVRTVYRNIVPYTSGANTYTPPAGLSFVKVTVTGGGGGGGGVQGVGAGDFGGASGGGGGGTAIKIIPASSLGATETATVGAGGNGGAAGLNNGLTGSNSTFGAHCTGNGGVLGVGALASTPLKTGFESSGGSSSGGDLNFYGFNSTKPVALGVSSGQSCSGGGGGSIFGGGGIGRRNSGVGAGGGTGTGGGGAGACNAGTAATDYAGGDGGSGFIEIEEYF